MLGASARYSCLHTPVETFTSPYIPPCKRRGISKLRRQYAGSYIKSDLLRLGILHTKGLNSDLLHDLGSTGLVVVVGANTADLIDNLDALNDLTESGVLAIQMGCVLVHDEELAAGGVGHHGAGHGQNAALVENGVIKAVCLELTADGVLGAAHAVAQRVAALDHEAGDNAMENETIVKALGNEGDKVVDGIWSKLGIELSLHDAAIFHFKSNNRIH